MNWKQIPSLNSLRAFHLVADTGSYTRAAEALNVTHAAIIQQVKALEQHLGIPLIERRGRSIRLTDEGRRLARDLEVGFHSIKEGVERISGAQADQSVQITMSPAFAVEWLMPRIPEFQSAHPDITLMLNPTSKLIPLKRGGIEVAIRYRDKRRPGSEIEPLLISDMIVIAAPSLIKGRNIGAPADLVDLPWLQELGTNEALDWLTYHGVVPDKPLQINQMPGNLIMNAVRRGDGITYTARAFFQEDLKAGRIVELFSEKAFGRYHLETASGPLRPQVSRFVEWLRSKTETVSA